MLIAAAADSWQVDPAGCRTEGGVVVHGASGRRLGYGDLVDAAARLPVPTEVQLKDPSAFRLIGTPAKRLDVAGKVNGAAVFGIDVKVPGMKIATVAASPVFGGTVRAFDEAAALQVAGVRRVAALDDAVAVIADHYWAAKQGLEAAAVRFDDGPNASIGMADIVAAMATASEQEGAVAQRVGDAAAAFETAAAKVEAVYETPFLAHAAMEPINCTVHVRSDGCDVWVGSQVVSRARATAAEVIGLPLEKVAVHNQFLGGGFGRRLEVDYVTQAVRIAKQVDGPVKVVWSREEDIRHDMYRPYFYDRVRAGLDDSGMPVAWSHRITGSSILARFFPPAFQSGVDFDTVDGAIDLPYAIPNVTVDYVRHEPPGIPTAFWRGVGPTHNVYVVESFVDELAAAAGKDPLAYRQALLAGNPRALGVLERAARMGAGERRSGRAGGAARAVQHVFGTYLAEVAEVSVAGDGEVRVDRVVCACDCGVVVNPDTVEAQLQSAIIFGLTAVLHGEITLENGRVEQGNFDDHQMLRIDQAPVIEIDLVASQEEPGGIGEAGTCALAPAVLNAVHAATGVRLRKLPIKPALLEG
jgi:isoquinoline 1-oxidoreductase beta subunit